MYSEFDTSRVKIQPLSLRVNNLSLDQVKSLEKKDLTTDALSQVARRIITAREKGAAVILMMGAHVIRSGVQRYLIDLMEKGMIDCIAVNGAGVIHDYEFALAGGTTETVSHYITNGQFGFWRETGMINDIVSNGAENNMGLGESIGRYIHEQKLPHRHISLFAAGYRLGIPVTVHVGIGQDIVHQMPNCNGAAYGETSYRDFLRFTQVMTGLENGVVMNFGSAVMAPEIYLKALSMVRNLAAQNDETISRFTTLVCDLVPLPENWRQEPSPGTPGYYFRPWKTMLVRTVKDGGESYYVNGRHENTIPELWSALCMKP